MPAGVSRAIRSPTRPWAPHGNDDVAGFRCVAGEQPCPGEGGGSPAVCGQWCAVPVYGKGDVPDRGCRARDRGCLPYQGFGQPCGVGERGRRVVCVLAAAGPQMCLLVRGDEHRRLRIALGGYGGTDSGLQEDAAGGDDRRCHQERDKRPHERGGLEADGRAGKTVREVRSEHQAAAPAWAGAVSAVIRAAICSARARGRLSAIEPSARNSTRSA